MQLGFVVVAVAYIGLLPDWVGCDMFQHRSGSLGDCLAGNIIIY